MTELAKLTDEQLAANMEAVTEVQKEFRNPVHQVALRAGFVMCREIMARFVENGGDATTAASIRANWMPQLGDDPGKPRRYAFDELAVENDQGGWDCLEVSAAREGACYAFMAMWQLLGEQDDEA